ncbi:hypothetical protein GmHk_10G028709 [Glycine max]|nr:hypothetical protein GmHk_10G028709 [Glycine max]
MPFGEALQQMPLYAKFLKDMLTRKHKYIHQENIVVEGNCNVVIQKILPPKHKDPGSVTIPCSIGDVTVGKTLIDLVSQPTLRREGDAGLTGASSKKGKCAESPPTFIRRVVYEL